MTVVVAQEPSVVRALIELGCDAKLAIPGEYDWNIAVVSIICDYASAYTQ